MKQSMFAMIVVAAVLTGCRIDSKPSSAGAPATAPGNPGAVADVEARALDPATREALLAALDDERRAEAFYRAVIRRLGDIRPFTSIVRAEQRHQDLLLPLLVKYGVPIPPDPHDQAGFEVPATRSEACAIGVISERDNIALYDRLIPGIREEDIVSAFRILRAASADHHLPAFERCAGR